MTIKEIAGNPLGFKEVKRLCNLVFYKIRRHENLYCDNKKQTLLYHGIGNRLTMFLPRTTLVELLAYSNEIYFEDVGVSLWTYFKKGDNLIIEVNQALEPAIFMRLHEWVATLPREILELPDVS